MSTLKQKQSGFTIVELLIVIVVIAILATITIVAYNGVSNRAKASAAQSLVSQAVRKVMAYAVDNAGDYPETLEDAGITNTTGLDYTKDNTATPKKFGVTATSGNVSYYMSNEVSSPTVGGYQGHGQNGIAAVTNLVTNPSFETGISGWGQYNGIVISSSTTRKQSGNAAMLVNNRTTTTDDFASMNTVLPEIGVPYTVSAWFYLGTGGTTTSANRHLWLYNQSGGSSAVDIDYPTPGSWQRVSGTITPTNPNLTIRVHSITGASFFIDSLMITKGTTLYNYADGNTPNWIWTGTPNTSTSKGPPTTP
jgi:prepilin-type N-terminal cleavage/methylation domain-containing protein